jgi:hypothetical protein
MRKSSTLIALLLTCAMSAQKPTIFNSGIKVKGNAIFIDTLILPDGSKLVSADLPFNGNRTITRSGIAQVNAGGESVVDFINNYFFPSTSPTVTISSSQSTSQEFMSSGAAITTNLTWSVTRTVACMPIATIIVNGNSQMPAQLSEGQTQTSVLNSQDLARNVNTTYTITATTDDDKTGTASTTISWYWKRYWGSIASNAAPSDAQIIALTGASVGSGSELSTTRAKTYNGINGGGNYLVFAFPSSWGTPVFKVYGLTNSAFTKVRDNVFINASGGSTTYQVWISNTTYNSAVSDFQIQ